MSGGRDEGAREATVDEHDERARGITEAELAAIEARAAVAFAGPWHYDDGITDEQTGERGKVQMVETLSGGQHELIAAPYMDIAEIDDANGRFIAHAREDVPRLAEEVRRLREVAREAEARGRAAGLREALAACEDRNAQAADSYRQHAAARDEGAARMAEARAREAARCADEIGALLSAAAIRARGGEGGA